MTAAVTALALLLLLHVARSQMAFVEVSSTVDDECKPGDPDCCGGAKCPFVKGVCCPGNGACCPEGSQCMPTVFGQRQMCSAAPPGWQYTSAAGGMLVGNNGQCECPQSPCVSANAPGRCPQLADCCNPIQDMQANLIAQLQQRLNQIQAQSDVQENPPPKPAAWPRMNANGQPQPLLMSPAVARKRAILARRNAIQKIDSDILGRNDAAIAALYGNRNAQGAQQQQQQQQGGFQIQLPGGGEVLGNAQDPSNLPKISVGENAARVLQESEAPVKGTNYGAGSDDESSSGVPRANSAEKAVAGVSKWLRKKHPRGNINKAIAPIGKWIRNFRTRHFQKENDDLRYRRRRTGETEEEAEEAEHQKWLANTIAVPQSGASSVGTRGKSKGKGKGKGNTIGRNAQIDDKKQTDSEYGGEVVSAASTLDTADAREQENSEASRIDASSTQPPSDLNDQEDNVDSKKF